uniref:ARAD1A02552p n=1 Tax=Blastobotrys adeninivorans TaxID=409370 RepID=A0A060T2M1_BLAAD
MISSDEELMGVCVQLLKDHYPKGLTIKQMAQLLEEENQPAMAFCRSSTILSTKLNSWYRRFTSSCPIARIQSPDTPNRLLYKYVVDLPTPEHSDDDEKERDKLDSKQVSVDDDESARSERRGSESDDALDGKNGAGDLVKGYNLRRVIKKTPKAFTPPPRRKSSHTDTPNNDHKNHNNNDLKVAQVLADREFNPYFDPIHNDFFQKAAGSAVAFTSWWIDDEELDHISNPEDMTLDDLDAYL